MTGAGLSPVLADRLASALPDLLAGLFVEVGGHASLLNRFHASSVTATA